MREPEAEELRWVGAFGREVARGRDEGAAEVKERPGGRRPREDLREPALPTEGDVGEVSGGEKNSVVAPRAGERASEGVVAFERESEGAMDESRWSRVPRSSPTSAPLIANVDSLSSPAAVAAAPSSSASSVSSPSRAVFVLL